MVVGQEVGAVKVEMAVVAQEVEGPVTAAKVEMAAGLAVAAVKAATAAARVEMGAGQVAADPPAEIKVAMAADWRLRQ
jgi:hypothetical protein